MAPGPRSPEAFERFSRATDGPLTVLAALWLPVLVIPLVVRLGPNAAASLNAIDTTIWALFFLEYLIKLGLAPRRWTYVRTHLLDLVVITLPFLRPVRALRFLRLIRAGTITGDALTRARHLLRRHGLQYVLLATVVIVFAGAAAELGFERHAPGSNLHTYGDALWWAVVTVTTVGFTVTTVGFTVTTVGYGDHYPVTVDGRSVAVVLMLIGIGLIGIVTANVAAFFVSSERSPEEQRLETIERRLEHIEHLLEALVELPSSSELEATDRDGGSVEAAPG